MSGRSPLPKTVSPSRQGARCQLILQKCLAIQLHKTGTLGVVNGPVPGRMGDTADYWMYDNGYLLFQGFMEANSKCFWNPSLLEAVKELQFEGYVAQGTLLVRGSPCALEVLRSAWSRNVLKAPTNYTITVVGDIEDCLVTYINQGQFTPLPEALCWVILELTSSGQNAVLDTIRNCLHLSFPDIERPSSQAVYDTLSKLMSDKKIYQTAQGYFIVTPESRRLRPQTHKPTDAALVKSHRRSYSDVQEDHRTKSLLMSTEEALTYVHGEMTTIRDGDVTHQSIQTNLADVICGGNPNDRILYPSLPKRSTSFPLERRNSLKLFGSNKRLNSSLTRSGSMKYIPHKTSTILTDSSSSTEYQAVPATLSTKKTSLLARLFRRSGRKRGLSAPPAIHTFSAQFPPAEWFNPKVIHMHCVGTQTRPQDVPSDSLIQWEIEPSVRYGSRMSKSPRALRRSPSEAHRTPDKAKRQEDSSSTTNTDSLRRRLDSSERTSSRQLYLPRRNSISKSSKSLNRNYEPSLTDKSDGRIYEEIKKSSDSFYGNGSALENIYTKIIEKKTRSNDVLVESKGKLSVASNPSTPKYKRKLEKRSSSLPRRKSSTQRLEPVTHTDFPYNEKLAKGEESPITPSLNNRRSNSYEDVNFEAQQGGGECKTSKEQQHKPCCVEDTGHDMTSLTSSGYDTQTNSIVSCEQVPYSLKISKNFLHSTTPPSSLTITEDLDHPTSSSRSASPYPSSKAILNVTSAISMTTGGSAKNSLSVQLSTNPNIDKLVVSSKNEQKVMGGPPMAPSPQSDLGCAPRLERFPSLYSPREVLKSGYGYEQVEFKPAQSEDSDLEAEFGKKLSDLDINSISTNQDEKDDYGLSHKPIPRSFNMDFSKSRGSSKIPVRHRGLARPVSIDSSSLILRSDDLHDFPSLSDLSVNFKSIAAQNILNNISVTSVDTLVEVNMAANSLNDKSIPSLNFTSDFGIL